jgi:hypothetical protein
MEIYVINNNRAFSGQLHFVVYDNTSTLIAASFAGIDTSVRAISASALEGRDMRVIEGGKSVLEIHCVYGEYRRIERTVNGPITHGLVLKKAAVFDEQHEAPVVLAPDGNIRRAVGRYMMARYALPQEWMDEYMDIIPPDGIEELQIKINPLNKKYKNLKAVIISSHYSTEEFILGEIDNRLKTGKLVIPPAPDPDMPRGQFDPGWSLKEYMTANAHVLASQLKHVRPRHVPGQDPLDPALAEMKRTPFPSQAHMIQGLVNALKEQDTAFCGADMGCGKSIMALGVAHLMHKAKKGKGMSVLLSAPGITIPKWVDNEIRATLPGAKVRILSSTADAARYARAIKNGYKPDGLEFVLVGIDRAKLGPEPWPAAIWKRARNTRIYAWHCPDCGQPLRDPDARDEEDSLAYWDVLAYGEPPENNTGPKTSNNLPEGFQVKWKNNPKVTKCTNCHAVLKRPALKARGETKNRPRYYISRILKKLRRHFDLFICDEVHQTKAQDSGRGDAFAQMVKAAKKCLFLTGTLVNGKSTSIKEILWRTDPAALIRAGFNHKSGMVAWASRYGVLKRITRVTEEDLGYHTRRKRTELQPTEEPGIAPQMIAQFLLHKVAFMELGDLGLPVVKLVERPVLMDLDKDHGGEYGPFHEMLYDACRKAMIASSGVARSGAFSKFIPATINYADRPDLGARVEIGRNLITAPEFSPDYYHAKERWLVETVKRELAENRNVIIGTHYTDGYGINWRLKEVLKAHGIESHVMTSSISTDKRVEWFARKAEENARVVILNMSLAEVGLDLLFWNTAVIYQLKYDINTVRQFSRRIWRIGALKECRVYYPVYNGTQQMSQFQNVMKKRGHAMMAEGRIDKSELAEFARDAHSAMASDLASCLADAGVADKWTELAAKDIDKNLRMVGESNYKDELQKAMRELAQETLRLCGVGTGNVSSTPKQKTDKPTITDMWLQLKDQIKPRRQRKASSSEGQLTLFDFGLLI